MRISDWSSDVCSSDLARLPYDRLALVAGFGAHILWGYGLYFAVHRYIRHRIAIVPFGEVERLKSIDDVEWRVMQLPELEDRSEERRGGNEWVRKCKSRWWRCP